MTTDYLPVLKVQHEEIVTAFVSSERYWKEKKTFEAWTQLDNLLVLLQSHLETECDSLFKKMRQNIRLKEGGPFCSYFFEFFMHNRPLVVAAKMITSRRGHPVQIAVPESLDVYFKEHSLLAIPLEEHLGIQALCKELILALKSYDPKEDRWIDDVFDTLKDMITTNQRKEETCLWVVAQQIMGPEQLADLSLQVCLPKIS